MSKFFKKDEESSSEDESSEEEQKTAAQKQAPKAQKKYFGGSEDEGDDEQRVIKSTTEKRTQALKQVFEKMKNHIKIDDFTQLQTDFDDMQSEIEKCAGQVFATDKLQTLPGWVLKGFVALEDCINDISAA